MLTRSPDTSSYTLLDTSLSSAACPSQPSSPYTHFANSGTSGEYSP